MPTIAHLRRLAKLIPEAVVYTQKDCVAQGHPFDPPCAYLSATHPDGRTIRVCVDGETFRFREGVFDEHVFDIDLTKPKEAAQKVWL